MFFNFFQFLRSHGIPVTLKEYLTFLGALDLEVANYTVDEFYALSRAIFIKHEKHLDLFDRLFGHFFQGIQLLPNDFFAQIPQEWLRKNRVLNLTEEEKALIEALGGPEKLAERFKELLQKQKERHEGGNKWIGTGGTSPFGAYGYNPEGYRIGQHESRHRRAIKVWDKREFRNLSDTVEINTRNLKLALKRLRLLTREGIPTELDIEQTIKRTSRNAGLLDLAFVPAKQNRVKVLLLFDVGGSMDEHVQVCEELFS
ncbi:MAG: VWA domain-containing protein, partial [Bacteroidia bacterium]|nr:VWA domain-containing protein [Bacteroidia bacterium]